MEAPHAPWELDGESVVGLVPACVTGSGRAQLPNGVGRVPGPCVLTAATYSSSPVGPYVELAVGEPAHLGARVGMCVTTMVVSSPASRIGGRLNWGFPKELGTLQWSVDGEERTLRWEERDIVVRATPAGPVMPVLVPLRALQRRADGPVIVPGKLRGRGRVAKVEVEVPEDDALAHFSGSHKGMVVSGMRLVVDPARRPAGRRATLLAPLRAPEPALSWGGLPQPTYTGD